MIKIAICDDEEYYIERLFQLLKKAEKDLKVELNINEFNSGEDFELNVINDLTYDLIFMDIELNEYNGLDIIERLKAVNNSAIVIFVTSYDCYVSKVFRLGAFQYLKKPIKYEDLIIDLNRAIEKINNNKNTVLIQINKEQKIIKLSDISYIEILCGDTYANISGETIKLDKRIPLIKLMPKLNDNFVKIHNSIIVNLNYVENVKSEYVILRGEKKLYFSRYYKKVFMDKFNSYLSGVKI